MTDKNGFPPDFHQASNHPVTDLHLTRQQLKAIMLDEIRGLWRTSNYSTSVLFDMTKAEDLVERICRRVAK